MQGYLSRFYRVYLVDDHDIVRRGVRDLLIPARDIDVVGDAGSVREAVPAILQLEPDIMLLDLHLQDGSGIEVCRAVRAVKPSIRGLLLTAAADEEATAAAVLAGAAGHVVKLSRSGNILDTIRKVQPDTTTLIDAEKIQHAALLLRSIVDSLTPRPTEVERSLLDLVIEGKTDGQIAAALPADRAGADIAALVARVADALLGNGRRSPEA